MRARDVLVLVAYAAALVVLAWAGAAFAVSRGWILPPGEDGIVRDDS